MARKGRFLRSNLLRDGAQRAAQHVLQVVGSTRGLHVVLIDPDGGVRVQPACKVRDMDALATAPNYIGAFTRMVEPEHVADCLSAWQP
jgi:hypothetical protein